jgi:hypothetical protein
MEIKTKKFEYLPAIPRETPEIAGLSHYELLFSFPFYFKGGTV